MVESISPFFRLMFSINRPSLPVGDLKRINRCYEEFLWFLFMLILPKSIIHRLEKHMLENIQNRDNIKPFLPMM